jgi:hypothetical protein
VGLGAALRYVPCHSGLSVQSSNDLCFMFFQNQILDCTRHDKFKKPAYAEHLLQETS